MCVVCLYSALPPSPASPPTFIIISCVCLRRPQEESAFKCVDTRYDNIVRNLRANSRYCHKERGNKNSMNLIRPSFSVLDKYSICMWFSQGLSGHPIKVCFARALSLSLNRFASSFFRFKFFFQLQIQPCNFPHSNQLCDAIISARRSAVFTSGKWLTYGNYARNLFRMEFRAKFMREFCELWFCTRELLSSRIVCVCVGAVKNVHQSKQNTTHTHTHTH